jgi:hypothetical protein
MLTDKTKCSQTLCNFLLTYINNTCCGIQETQYMSLMLPHTSSLIPNHHYHCQKNCSCCFHYHCCLHRVKSLFVWRSLQLCHLHAIIFPQFNYVWNGFPSSLLRNSCNYFQLWLVTFLCLMPFLTCFYSNSIKMSWKLYGGILMTSNIKLRFVIQQVFLHVLWTGKWCKN